MAKRHGVSRDTVQRIWKQHGLQPHRLERFKLSRDPQFVEKVRDVVGLYLHPPQHALVLSVDEKSQIQALDRTQPVLPLRPGLPARQTHDYIRHGTTTLFAALNVFDGKVIGQCLPRRFPPTVEKVSQVLFSEPGGSVIVYHLSAGVCQGNVVKLEAAKIAVN